MQAILISLLGTALAMDGVVPISLERVKIENHPNPHMAKRATRGGSTQSVLDTIDNQRYFYTTTAKVGTPAQDITLLLDTGSSDTWVIGPHTTQRNGILGTLGGLVGLGNNAAPDTTLFDTTQSSTWHDNSSSWTITYGRGSAKGEWGTDTFQIGNTKLNSLTIGVANQVNSISQGLIGLGRPESESTYKQGFTYNNLPAQLKAEGKINSIAYSLYMNDINSHQGTILFGGVDHSRYTGRLVAMPIAHPEYLAVELQGIYSDGRETDNNMDKPLPAVLDSGTSLSYMPSDILTNIRTALNANPSFELNERYYCDCNITENLTLDFGSTRVNVPAYEFLWPLTELVSRTTEETFFPQNSCYLGIEEATGSSSNFILLGDNILRSMYIVYDLDNQQIAVAQASRDGSAPSAIQAISIDGIPGAM